MENVIVILDHVIAIMDGQVIVAKTKNKPKILVPEYPVLVMVYVLMENVNASLATLDLIANLKNKKVETVRMKDQTVLIIKAEDIVDIILTRTKDAKKHAEIVVVVVMRQNQ